MQPTLLSEETTTTMAALLTLLLLHVFPISTIAIDIAGFWSIDCGGSKPFTRSYGIPWVNDTGYVRTGESHPIRKSIPHLPPELKNLRAFTSKKKNCYTVPVKKGSKILARVKFYYGNYDKLKAPPSFDLMFDGNRWTTVSVRMDKVDMYEMVYVAKRNGTSICVGRHQGGLVPFISSIEVRTLRTEMYAAVGSNYALYLARSVAFGAKKSIRYPDDAFDRLWTPKRTYLDGNGFAFIKRSNTVTISTTTNSSRDNPPLQVFDAAAAPPERKKNLTIKTSKYPLLNPSSIYLNMYFTEMATPNASLNETRSFHIYMDKKLISDVSDPIVPPSGGVVEFNYSSRSAMGKKTEFDLVPTLNSTLPPTLNAMEVFSISDVLNDLTNTTDVHGLAVLQKRFQVLQNWTGDPCRPTNYNWEWVACNSNSTPRITQLLLSGYGLSGSLPDFSALSALEIIKLDGNSLSGDIPKFLGNLSNLKILNLADNNFATIPASLLANKKIILDISGNPKLCSSDPNCLDNEPTESFDETNSSAEKEGNKIIVPFFSSLVMLLVILGMV